MSKLTLEETAKKYAGISIQTTIDSEERYYNSNTEKYDAFLAGAEYQSKNMPIYIYDVSNIHVHIKDGAIIVEKHDKDVKTFNIIEFERLIHQAVNDSHCSSNRVKNPNSNNCAEFANEWISNLKRNKF